MSKHELLDNITHKDLKVITRHSANQDSRTNAVLTFPTEYADIQREYPILFTKDKTTGEFQSIALLGFEKGENLFDDEGTWDATYIPAIVERGPFLIGFQEQEINGEIRREPVIHIDMDDPRVNETEGEPIFLEHGGHSPYLQKVTSLLKSIHDGMAISKAMFKHFEALDLIEPASLEITLSHDEQYQLSGYYTINKDRLAELDGNELEKLNKAGFLEGAFLIMASLNNVSKMVNFKNKKRLKAN